MASTPLSRPLHAPDSIPWMSLLRATLRECSYLPDPIARGYMREYVVNRYRRSRQSHRSDPELARTARHGLSLLQRANEGYQRPLERVLLMSYGRIGKRRHELLAQLMKPQVPSDTDALKELVAKPIAFEDGWEPPEIVMSLAKSQMHNGILSTSRVRPALKNLQPPIPETNSWGRPVSRVRRVNIRKNWYGSTLETLLPPLPDAELRVLDGLIEGTVAWAPRPRKPATLTAPHEDNHGDESILKFLTEGPQKGHTFRDFANGRPHEITDRFMRRQWRRISCLVPRMHYSVKANKWFFIWDTPKVMPELAFEVDTEANPDQIFGGSVQGRDQNQARGPV
ncbi:uncharacterized protein N7482_002445 [Penicillium canariense]|uniref:LYR motif-containing protein Cup1-like N-terminal domain-containing protein n=1 Tax=Penicillium canariense TaxID=189055 RepID=A0A9W9LTX2_9EURO|nr:uncharacterized protein N7482_002445 [Penicillium canariense]KAJ5176568.1 hypothetical protein N7482_002445 [Penicillium canariense]